MQCINVETLIVFFSMTRSWIQAVVLNKDKTKKNDFAGHFGRGEMF